MSCSRPGTHILDAINSAYDQREAEGFASGKFSPIESMDFVIKLTEQRTSTTIILDALDESDPENLPEILNTLQDILPHSSGLVKIFVSSRDDQDIM